MSPRNGVDLARRTEVDHLLGQDFRKLSVHGIGNGRRHLQAICLDETVLYIREKEKRPRPVKLLKRNQLLIELRGKWVAGSFTHVVSDAHVDQLVLASVVDQVVAVGVSGLAVTQVNPLDDVLRNFSKVSDAIGELCQGGRTPRDDAVQNRHYAAGSSLSEVRVRSSSFLALRVVVYQEIQQRYVTFFCIIQYYCFIF